MHTALSSRSRQAGLVLLLLAPLAAGQSTWYVDVNGTPPGSGTQTDPYTSIQYAIEQGSTVSGDSVLVLPGLYAEHVDFRGKALDLRSTGGPKVTTIRPATPADCVVLAESGEGPGTRVAGFTLTGGGPHGSLDPKLGNGGCGVFCSTTSFLRVEDCHIVGNGFLPLEHGGGVLGVPELVDCWVGYNTAGVGGGGAALGRVERCVFERNSAGYGAGGLAFAEEILDSVFLANDGGDYAGGVYVVDDCRIRGCTFVDNNVGSKRARIGGLRVLGGSVRVEDTVFSGNLGLRGGGAAVEGGSATFLRCRFDSNRARPGTSPGSGSNPLGGGLYVAPGALATVERCLFGGNWAELGAGGSGGQGGAVWGSPLMVGCTLADNVAELAGGGVASGPTAGAVLRSCIVWGNLPDPLDATAVATFSDVEGGWPGTGNIAGDPLFFAPGATDYHLRPGSPAIDAGDPADPPDPDGSPADMGAFPFEPRHCTEPAPYCTARTDSAGCTPSLGWSGTATQTGPDDFVLRATGLRNGTPGMVFFGLAAPDLPLQAGSLCVRPPLFRTPLQSSGGSPPPSVDCSGTLVLPFSQALMSAAGLAAYTPVYAQCWYRDPSSARGVGLSDAIVFVVCP